MLERKVEYKATTIYGISSNRPIKQSTLKIAIKTSINFVFLSKKVEKKARRISPSFP